MAEISMIENKSRKIMHFILLNINFGRILRTSLSHQYHPTCYLKADFSHCVAISQNAKVNDIEDVSVYVDLVLFKCISLFN